MKLRIESASIKQNKILFHEFSTNAFSLMQIVSVALKYQWSLKDKFLIEI